MLGPLVAFALARRWRRARSTRCSSSASASRWSAWASWSCSSERHRPARCAHPAPGADASESRLAARRASACSAARLPVLVVRAALALSHQRRLPVPGLQRHLASTSASSRCCTSSPRWSTCCSPCRSASWPIARARRVFVGGYALLLPVYASLLLPALGIAALPVCLLLFGATTRRPTAC